VRLRRDVGRANLNDRVRAEVAGPALEADPATCVVPNAGEVLYRLR
jgi:hypothetical protein